MRKVINLLLNSRRLPLKSSGSSMEPVFKENDLLYFKKTPFNKIRVNDIVSIKKGDQLISHRVIYKTSRYLITKGDNSPKSDGKVYPKNIIGKVYQVKRNRDIFHPENLYLLQSTLYFQEIIKIKQEFEKEKINFVFLKGLPLHLYFEKYHPPRLYYDCDVLVDKKNLTLAEKILFTNGYRKSQNALTKTHQQLKEKEIENTYIKVINNFPVVFDLHLEVVFMMTQLGKLNALYPQSFIDQLTDKFLKTKRVVTIEKQKFLILNSKFLILYLALHLFHHNFRGAFRYDFLDKIIRKEKLRLDSVKYLTEIIKKYRLGNFVYPVFVLLTKYYQTPLPPSFLKSIQPSNFTNLMNFIDFKNLDIFDDEPRLRAGINRFINLLYLSPNPLYKRLLVFINPSVVYLIFWAIFKKLFRINRYQAIQQKSTTEKINIIINFLFQKTFQVSFFQKLQLIIKFFYISIRIDCLHTNTEMLTIAQSIFNIPPSVKGLIVEAGAYKGGSTAKLSLIANAVGRKLVVFDSFQGIPPNQEIHINVNYPKKYIIPEGLFYGSLAEVKKNVKTYGSPEVCIFKKGWFDKTLPLFNQKIVAIFLDVDLAASTRICLKYLYPRLQPGGILYSHDGFHILVTEVYQDKIFWKRELGLSPPLIYGIGKQKLIKIIKSK